MDHAARAPELIKKSCCGRTFRGSKAIEWSSPIVVSAIRQMTTIGGTFLAEHCLSDPFPD